MHQLPSLLQDVESEISWCRGQLQRLGTPRTTLREQRRYLLRVSQEFTVLMQAAVDGNYNNPFFGSAKTDAGYRKRLRAVVQNTLADFGENMRLNGQSRIIVDFLSDDDPFSSRYVSRSNYVDEVKDLMRRSRGRELLGTFNPLIIGELFVEQCQPWKSIAIDAEKSILRAVYGMAQAILDHVSVDETADGIFRIISGGIDSLKSELNCKMKALLNPHHEGHPITLNHYLTDNVHKAQADRRRRSLEKAFEECLGIDNFKQIEDGRHIIYHPPRLFALLKQRTEVDMERYGSELAVDYMLAYYNVSVFRARSGVLSEWACIAYQILATTLLLF